MKHSLRPIWDSLVCVYCVYGLGEGGLRMWEDTEMKEEASDFAFIRCKIV